MEELKQILDLGGTVAVVGGFLWYLRDKNGKTEKIQQQMLEAIERNTKVLIKVATKHGYMDDADELMSD